MDEEDRDHGDEDSLAESDVDDARYDQGIRDYFEEKWQRFKDGVAEERAKRTNEFYSDNSPAFDQEETEPDLTDGNNTRCVRVVDVVMAIHLLTGRAVFHNLGELLHKQLEKLILNATKITNALSQLFELGHAIARVSEILGLLLGAFGIFREATEQRELERGIRELSLKLRNELQMQALNQARRRRRYKLVSSRHYTPPRGSYNKKKSKR